VSAEAPFWPQNGAETRRITPDQAPDRLVPTSTAPILEDPQAAAASRRNKPVSCGNFSNTGPEVRPRQAGIVYQPPPAVW
jgi:hypothetical protein